MVVSRMYSRTNTYSMVPTYNPYRNLRENRTPSVSPSYVSRKPMDVSSIEVYAGYVSVVLIILAFAMVYSVYHYKNKQKGRSFSRYYY